MRINGLFVAVLLFLAGCLGPGVTKTCLYKGWLPGTPYTSTSCLKYSFQCESGWGGFVDPDTGAGECFSPRYYWKKKREEIEACTAKGMVYYSSSECIALESNPIVRVGSGRFVAQELIVEGERYAFSEGGATIDSPIVVTGKASKGYFGSARYSWLQANLPKPFINGPYASESFVNCPARTGRSLCVRVEEWAPKSAGAKELKVFLYFDVGSIWPEGVIGPIPAE